MFHAELAKAAEEGTQKYVADCMENQQEILTEFGKRIQRCYGCFIAYHLKDMYLGEDVTFFCEHCKDENMFHFDDFARLMDVTKLKEVAEEEHHH
jgi:hypothetical protein